MSVEPIELLPRYLRAHQGSRVITRWCPRCQERVVPIHERRCGWCDYWFPVPIEADPLEQARREQADSVMLALRKAGMSYTNIALACRILLNWRISDEAVRYRLRDKFGVPAKRHRGMK
jgi:hypothetical protein